MHSTHHGALTRLRPPSILRALGDVLYVLSEASSLRKRSCSPAGDEPTPTRGLFVLVLNLSAATRSKTFCKKRTTIIRLKRRTRLEATSSSTTIDPPHLRLPSSHHSRSSDRSSNFPLHVIHLARNSNFFSSCARNSGG
ncbi:hypothetical protein K443DRAFT_408254 [Laccaria amethystina LaAM-08-1]|uniref:Uncharacterized protein n=1 Tax=Laccaria amethystina LaAM-08-1 TaxID=1095629 RepID=A0A0C9WWI5_9AGAR|nr:hypothetical protein K443DRAFT_408254 [Laccaria amethystina LaAM-08-1]